MNDMGISTGIKLSQVWETGGPLMWVLAGLSAIALAVVLYLLLAQRRGALAPHALISDVFNRLQTGDVSEARRLCQRHPCAFGVIAVAAFDAVTGAPQGSRPPVATAVETAGAHIAERIQGAVDWLADIAAVAPLVGLLGTVLGMYKAFGSIASDLAANARPTVLAQGVSEAIITTMFGLMVSIPCLVFHAMLRRRAARRISGLETLAVALEKAFA